MNHVRDYLRSWLTKETVLLFGIAIAVRVVLSLLQISYGEHRIPGVALNDWSDFYLIYAPWFGFLHHGLLPYRDFPTYKYTPLFLYILYPFFLAGGGHAAAVPMVASDAATAVVVYLVVGRFAGTKIAFAAGLTYALSPFILYEADYLWLSSQPMTLFMLLAVYLFRENKPTLSMASLAVAVMFKQEAVFILPAFLVLYAKEYKKEALKGIGVFALIVFVLSLPFLIVAPLDYIYGVNYLPIQEIINLGPREASIPIASQIVNSVPPSPPSLSAQGPAYASFLGILDRMANFLNPLLLALLAPALYAVRKTPHFLELSCAYSLLLFLTLYSILVAPTYAYYFVPVYAVIFASIRNARTLAVGVATTLLSLLAPEGPFEVIPPLVCLFFIIAFQDWLQPSRDAEAVVALSSR